MIARDLGLSAEPVRTLVRRMARDGHIATRDDGWYFATSTTARSLAAHRARRTGPPPAPMLPPVVEHLQHLRRRGLRASSIDQRRKELHRLGAWLGGQETEILAATTEQLVRYCDLRRGVEGRRAVVNHVRGFYRWAHEIAELVERNPALKLIRPRMPAPRPRPIAEDRLARALELADDPVRTWLLLAAYCGLRACEIAPLHGDDVHLDQLRLVLRERKGGKQGVVPLAPVVADALEPKLGHGWIWPSPRAGRPITAEHVSKRANTFLRSVDVPDTLHSLRHRYGTQMYELSGSNLRLVQECMGHSSPSVTAMYVQVSARAGAEVAALLPGA
jgi:integrase/recombinase XerC